MFPARAAAFILFSFLTSMTLPADEAPLIIAHRGASQRAPENTASSIKAAISLGAKVIEFDVRVTRDGALVLFHDDKLERLTGRPGTIEASDWTELSTLDVGTWFANGGFAGEKILAFDDALKLCFEAGVTPLIEHKTGDAKPYAKVIRSLEGADRVIVQSFDWEFLSDFQKEMPTVPIGALGSKVLTAEQLVTLAGLQPAWVGWKVGDLTADDLPKLRELGAKIALWTVNEPAVARTWVELGVDAIITDVPDVIAAEWKR